MAAIDERMAVFLVREGVADELHTSAGRSPWELIAQAAWLALRDSGADARCRRRRQEQDQARYRRHPGPQPGDGEKHLERVYEKLGVETRTAAAGVATQRVPELRPA